jgi:hypothetical protein
MLRVRICTILLTLLGVAMLLGTAAYAQAPGGAGEDSVTTGSPFGVTSSLDVGAAALEYCNEPTRSICNAACECLFPGPGGAFCIADETFTCSLTHCDNEIDCDEYWPE